MKKIIMSLLLLSNISYAGWADSDFKEPTIGCVGLGGIMYLTSSSADAASKFQSFFMGCALGGATLYGVNQYYEEKVGEKYKGDIDKLSKQLSLYQKKQAINASLGISEDHYTKYTVIPGTKNPDGSLTTPAIKIEQDQPGNELILND